MFPFWNHANGYYMDMDATSASNAVPQNGAGHLASMPDVQFTSTTMCPKNFVIFDQTNWQSQIMFHPSLLPKLGIPNLPPSPANYGENLQRKGIFSEQRQKSLSYEESADIDALLGSEIENGGVGEEIYDDDDEVSAGRTNGNYECYSPDSCSTDHASKPVKLDDSCSGNVRKGHEIQEMVKVLQGIVPGGNRMSTAKLLDEAVRYLKVMKIEAAKLGNFSN